MINKLLTLILLFASITFACNGQTPVIETGVNTASVTEWIDASTHHKIKRLTNGEGNRSFYFHNNPFLKSKDGKDDLMIYYGAVEGNNQLFSLNLKTNESRQLTTHEGKKRGEIVGRKRRVVFYQIKDTIFTTHIDTKETKKVFVFPDNFKASISTLNADETLLAGTWASPEKDTILKNHPSKGEFFDRIFDAKLPHTLFSVNVDNGELKEIHAENTWLGHIQFSTTDPDVLMFCHEGPWHKVDRIWNVNLKTNNVEKVHERTVYREIAGHEFWSWDGKTIYYDLQIPRGETFYLAAYDVESNRMKKYELDRNEWSIHFNISPDQKLFCGDGGDSGQVAKAKDGMWIYLFTPSGDTLESQKLVNMKHHGYKLEPNVHFSPDGQSIIFRANFDGTVQIYAVEIEPSAQ
ncbi:oligogalacturonate lyase family protein [Portibacter lacus]|uniref:Oligogalacturonate lyase n=1 Tax=Portibacter lacus TaxID=1099794 RepID=A0AA37WFN9_9BACT|nr:oligogalacturonate lyase family protein [Portibacter lacus]GLR18973.1 oligogalacturonate lyase [Portibacter lacus]